MTGKPSKPTEAPQEEKSYITIKSMGTITFPNLRLLASGAAHGQQGESGLTAHTHTEAARFYPLTFQLKFIFLVEAGAAASAPPWTDLPQHKQL